MKAAARRLAPLVALLLLPFLVYWKLFSWNPDERKIFRGDFLNQHFVWKSYALERIKQGELPLWNPHVLGGVAMHANPQVGVFYPPNYLLLLFHRNGEVSYMALEAFQLLHQVLAGVGMWLLLSSLGLRRWPAWGGAVVFMFTGFFTTPGHHTLVLTAAWIPLNLYLVGRAVESSGPRSLAGLAVGLSMMVLAGHPQPAYYGVLLATAWAFYLAGWRKSLRRFVPALALAGLMASIQLIPTVQLARESTREGAGYGYSTTFGFSPFFLPGAVVPRGQVLLPGQDPSTPLHIYVGIGGLLLAGVGVVGSRRQTRWFFLGVAAASLLLSMGSLSFLFDLTYAWVPAFNRFRIPYRLLGLYALAMSALVGLGLDALASGTRRIRKRLNIVVQGAFGLLLLLAAWSAYAHTQLLVSPGALEPRQVERLVSGVNWALLLVLLNGIALVVLTWRSKNRWSVAALIALLVVDLGSFVKDRGQHPYSTLARAGERPVNELIRAQSFRGRYVTDSNLESYSMLHGTEFAGGQDSLIDERYTRLLDKSRGSANVLSLLNVKWVVRAAPLSKIPWCGPRFPSPLPLIDIPPSLSPLTLRLLPATEAGNLRVYWSRLEPGAGGASVQLNSGETHPLVASPWEASFIDRENVRRLTVSLGENSPGIRIDQVELDGSPLGLLADFVEVHGIRLNLHSLPRAYFVDTSREIPETPSGERLECWTPHEPVLITDPDTGDVTGGYFRSQGVHIVRYEPETIEIEVESPRPGFVVLADTFRPGWHAAVDGESRPVLRAQSALRAVPLEAGRHRVVLVYRPLSLYAGAGLSLLATLTVLVLASGKQLWRSEYPAPPPRSNRQP